MSKVDNPYKEALTTLATAAYRSEVHDVVSVFIKAISHDQNLSLTNLAKALVSVARDCARWWRVFEEMAATIRYSLCWQGSKRSMAATASSWLHSEKSTESYSTEY